MPFPNNSLKVHSFLIIKQLGFSTVGLRAFPGIDTQITSTFVRTLKTTTIEMDKNSIPSLAFQNHSWFHYTYMAS